MSEGYFRTQCRGCDLRVYEGPWIPPRERHLLHEQHRALCTSAPPTAPDYDDSYVGDHRAHPRCSSFAASIENPHRKHPGRPRKILYYNKSDSVRRTISNRDQDIPIAPVGRESPRRLTRVPEFCQQASHRRQTAAHRAQIASLSGTLWRRRRTRPAP